MNRKKIAIVMAFALVVQMLPLPAGCMVGVFDLVKVSQAATPTSGTDGNIKWALTKETAQAGWMDSSKTPYKLTLTKTGTTGEMKAYSWEQQDLGNDNIVTRTNAPWGAYYDQIQTISIGSGITNISSSAFYNCHSVLSVTIPAGVKTIGTYAFEDCSALKQITLPEGLESIESGAFAYCTAVASVTLPSTLTKLGSSAFSNCQKLTEVTVPGNVETIGSSAFYWCNGLKKVTISEGVKSIDANAFASCGALTQLTLPKATLTTLGDNCFANTKLEEFSVPASVTKIGINPCAGVTTLLSVKVGTGNTNYRVTNDMLVELQDSTPYKVICYPGAVGGDTVVPNAVQVIGSRAFANAKIQSVDLPGSLLTIEDYAFSSASALTEIDIPGNVSKIGNYAFQSCISLKNITLGSGLLSIGNSVFSQCRALTAIELPDKVTSIGDNAFSGCSSLREMDFPNSLAKIGASVFSGCSSLERVSFGQELQTISGNVFSGCSKLGEITISSGNPYMVAEDNVIYNTDKSTLIYYAAAKADDKFSIPDAVTTVGTYAFNYITELVELRFPASVKKLESNAVYHNENLGKLLFYGDSPSVVEGKRSLDYKAGTYTYYNASIRENKVGGGSYDNSGLVIFYTQDSQGWEKGWTDSVTSKKTGDRWEKNYILSEWDPTKTDVAEGIFGDLTWTYRDDIGELEFFGSGRIPDFSLDELPTWNDEGEESHMKDIKLLQTGPATEVGDYAFYGAEKLRRILSGNELERVGEQAFAKCSSLQVVQVQSAAQIEKEAFLEDVSIQDGMDVRGAKVIGEGAFRGCNAMTDILLGEHLTTLEKEVFQGCSALESLILPESLLSIGDGCFRGCETLRTLNIPKDVDTVPKECFKDCSNFQKIYFYGNCPKSWAEDAFDGTHEKLTIYYRAGNTTWSDMGNSWNGIPVEGLYKFYTEGEDNYSFDNSSNSFGYDADYLIPRQRYVTALQSIIRGSYYYAWSTAWKGSCFGMAASSTEFYQGEQFDVQDYSASAKTLFDVAAPGNPNAELTKLIEIYQVSQFVEEVSWEEYQNDRNYRKLIKQVEEFERSGGLDVDSTADPLILCVYSGKVGHALVPVSVNMDEEGNYILKVYDCNYPNRFRELTVKKDFTEIDYVSGFYRFTSASFVKYSTIRDALVDADFTGKNLKKESDESSKVSIAINREDVTLTNGGGRDFEEIKDAYEQKPLSEDEEDEFSGIRSFVLPQGEYIVQEDSRKKDDQEEDSQEKDSQKENRQQEELRYYVATEDLFSEIECSDPEAELTVNSVKGTGYDTITLSSEDSDTKSELTVMDVSGIEKEIVVQGSEVSIEILDDSEMTLSVSKDTTLVEVDGEEIDLSKDQANISFYASEDDNPMKIQDMRCDLSLDENDRLSGEAEAYVTWAREDSQDVDVIIRVTEEDGSVLAEHKEKTNLSLGMQKLNVTLEDLEIQGKDPSVDTRLVYRMTLVDAKNNKVQAVCSGAVLKAKEQQPEVKPTPTATAEASPTPTATAEVTPTPTATSEVTTKPTGTPEVTAKPTETPKETPKETPTPTGTPDGTSSQAPNPTVSPDTTQNPAATETPGTTEKPVAGQEIFLPQKGEVKTVGALKYIVLKSSEKNGTVAVCGTKKKAVKSVVIPKKVKVDGYSFQVVSIYKNAFSGNSKLSKVTIGANVTIIGNGAFKNCKKLEFIIIPKKVTTIGKKAFAGCTGLRCMLVRSDKIKSVGAKAFLGIDSRMTVKTSKNKSKEYARLFVDKGKMPRNAKFITDPAKLKYNGKSY